MFNKSVISIFIMGLSLGFSDEGNAKKLDIANGRKTFQTYCISCHGAQGKGDGPVGMAINPKPTNFTDVGLISSESKSRMYLAISEGGKKVGLSPMMAAWKTSLKAGQINNVLAYVLMFSEDSAEAVHDVLQKSKAK